MRAARKTPEEQYRLVVECRRSGLTDCDWCRENGININTFYAWVGRLRKEARQPISDANRYHACDKVSTNEVVKVDILPDELRNPSDDKDVSILVPQAGISTIEIEVKGITFRFTGMADASLYEKILFMIGDKL